MKNGTPNVVDARFMLRDIAWQHSKATSCGVRVQ